MTEINDGFLKLLRANGVQSYSDADIKLTFFDRPPPIVAVATQVSHDGSVVEEVCACGHPMEHHNDAGCLDGDCSEAKCMPRERVSAE